jgi:pimeloyl-ACP methyl ester carboxylesterase
VPEVFVLCHNPVDPKKGDVAACGKEGTSPRLGDLRFNVFNYVQSPQAAAPWGIMVDAEDPLTGEKISGSVNQYGGTLDKAAGQLVDLVNLLNGVTPADQFITGKDVSDWVQQNRADSPKSRPAPMSAKELTGRLGAFDPMAKVSCPVTLVTGDRDQMTPPKATRELARTLKAKVLSVPSGHSLMAEAPDAVLQALRGALA